MDDCPTFFITDVFAERKYSGNQLATFLNCSSLTDNEMGRIAREMNFSESTFVICEEEQPNGGYDVRIFTPGGEIDFAGHPTLGTAFIIQKHIIQRDVEKVVLNLKVGQIPVSFPAAGSEGPLWMRQPEPTFGPTLDAEPIARVLGLDESEIDGDWPIDQVSTGLPTIIVPLKTLDALKRASVIKEYYYELVDQLWAKAVLIFSPERYNEQHDLSVRVFVDYYGIPEDPATGSGNGCLAAYLVKHRYFGASAIDIKTGQGYEIGRPSLLLLRAKEGDGHLEIAVGGRVLPIARGRWGDRESMAAQRFAMRLT